MPLPVKPNETQKEFVSRCIETEMKNGATKDNRQAAAICYSKWQNRNKKQENK
jgi:hypothetical protein